jgi:hypothetical protein
MEPLVSSDLILYLLEEPLVLSDLNLFSYGASCISRSEFVFFLGLFTFMTLVYYCFLWGFTIHGKIVPQFS